MGRRAPLSNSHKCNGIITLSRSLGSTAAVAFCSAGEMHCDIAVIYDAESRGAQIPSVSRIIVS